MRSSFTYIPQVFPTQRALFAILQTILADGEQIDEIVLLPPKEIDLTPIHLERQIVPFLKSIGDIQSLIDELNNRESRSIKIRAITQSSPISVSLEGASEAIGLLREVISPWRREHAKKLAQLKEKELQIALELKKAEVLEKRAKSAKERMEVQKLREEAERLQLENERLRIEIQREKVQLAIDILAQLAPDLSETERVEYLVRLLPVLDRVVSSELEVAHSR